jgi:hypothetical protein
MISLFLILAISENFAYAARIPWQGLLQGALTSPLGNSNPQTPINNSSLAELRKRQVTSFESTCGYNTENPDSLARQIQASIVGLTQCMPYGDSVRRQ